MIFSNRRRRDRAYRARPFSYAGLLEVRPAKLQRVVRVLQPGAGAGLGPGSARSDERQDSNVGRVGTAGWVFVGLLNTVRVLPNTSMRIRV